MTPQKPPAILLVLLHSLALAVYVLHDVQNAMQLYISLFALLILIILSGVYHQLLWLGTRKWPVRNAIRIPAYFLPGILFVTWGLLQPVLPQLPNQTSPLSSPSKRYTMKMEIENNRWIVSIFDTTGKELYRDQNSQFIGTLNVYWIWDEEDRLWLYNSDSGFVYYWAAVPQGWKKICWGWEHKQKSAGNFRPPESLFPDYAKKIP